MDKICGSIYILTNPSFENYVKIGFSENVKQRIKELNRSVAVPFGFRLYATYDVETVSADKRLHKIIDKLNSNLRSIDNIDNKTRTREFYLIKPQDAYEILEDIAELSGTTERLHLYEKVDKSENDKQDEIKSKDLLKNRHGFKKVLFYSSCTNKFYYSETKEDGTLGVFEKENGVEVPNNSTPSKKQILLQAVKDLKLETDDSKTLYQLQHQLQKELINKD